MRHSEQPHGDDLTINIATWSNANDPVIEGRLNTAAHNFPGDEVMNDATVGVVLSEQVSRQPIGPTNTLATGTYMNAKDNHIPENEDIQNSSDDEHNYEEIHDDVRQYEAIHVYVNNDPQYSCLLPSEASSTLK